MIKIKINSLDEAAKWRSTGFKTEWTEKDIEDIEKKYDPSLLFVHYDDGVIGSSGIRQPQATFNPQTKYNTPIGIYCYPWEYARDPMMDKGRGPLPFAQDKQFLYIYVAKDADGVINIEDAERLNFFPRTISLAVTKYGKDADEIEEALRSSELDRHDILKILKLFFPKKFKKTDRLMFESVDEEKANYVFNTLINNLLNDFDLNDSFSRNHLQNLFEPLKRSIIDEFEPEEGENEWDQIAEYGAEEGTRRNKNWYVDLMDEAYDDVFEDDAIEKDKYDKIVEENWAAVEDEMLELHKEKYEFEKAKKDKIESMPDVIQHIPTVEQFASVFKDEEYYKYWFYFVNNIFDNSPVKVTKYLQKDLDIKILVDKGTGTIHQMEPTQAIIFNPAFATLIGAKVNPSKEREQTINPHDKVSSELAARAIKKFFDSPKGKQISQELEKDLDTFQKAAEPYIKKYGSEEGIKKYLSQLNKGEYGSLYSQSFKDEDEDFEDFEDLEESKLFKFNKDKKMFKLLR